jgi:uncharacterized protein
MLPGMMPSEHESFWSLQTYAVVGHSAKRKFPVLTYGGLKKNGKTVYAVDPSTDKIDGDRAYPDLASLPAGVQAVVIEVPRDETQAWVEKAAALGVKDVWLHMNTETPEAISLAKKSGVRIRSGTCAVMYLRRGFTVHSLHRLINKVAGKY